jgi:activator of HSP90 ATPase
MVNRPSQPEIITVNSEELQTLIRDLLPSQNGFGSELQASNVITPIIDLTATAEGSTLRQDLQTALALGSATEFSVENSSATIASSPGFYQITGTSVIASGSGTFKNRVSIVGTSTVDVWEHGTPGISSGTSTTALLCTVTVWLKAGESLEVDSNDDAARFSGSVRQIADSTGAFVNPQGFPL